MCKKKKQENSQVKKSRYQRYLNSLTDKEAKRYLTDIVFPQMDFYSKKSAKNKKSYIVFSIISIICNAVIPILVLIDESFDIKFWIKLVVAVISAAAGVLTAITALMSYRELWLKYRLTLERLKRIIESYLARGDEFFDIKDNDDECRNLLVKLCRAEMDEEHRAWEKLVGNDGSEQA